MERFIGYLRHSFFVPLASRLKQAGLTLDAETANLEVLKWLRDVANARTHQTTQAVPAQRWAEERKELLALPLPTNVTPLRIPATDTPPPQQFEPVNLQHPLAVYEAMLQEAQS